jgi:hypothetical protein
MFASTTSGTAAIARSPTEAIQTSTALDQFGHAVERAALLAFHFSKTDAVPGMTLSDA